MVITINLVEIQPVFYPTMCVMIHNLKSNRCFDRPTRFIKFLDNYDWLGTNVTNKTLDFRKQNRYEDATKVLIRATQRVSGSLFHVTSLANILIKRDKITEAENVLHPLLRRNCMESEFTISKSCPPSYFPAVRAYANLQLKRGETNLRLKVIAN